MLADLLDRATRPELISPYRWQVGDVVAIVDKLHAEIRSAVETDKVKKRFSAEGAEAQVGGPKALQEFHRADVARWSAVIRDSGVLLQ